MPKFAVVVGVLVVAACAGFIPPGLAIGGGLAAAAFCFWMGYRP